MNFPLILSVYFIIQPLSQSYIYRLIVMHLRSYNSYVKRRTINTWW